MTLEQLLDCDAEKLEKMTDAELLAHFEPFLAITRPDRASASLKDRAAKGSKTKLPTAEELQQAEKIKKAKAIAAQLGLGNLLDNI